MAINIAIETFEDNAERILWLPTLTLGYTYSLSGEIFQFALAITAIGGAQIIRFLMKSDFDLERGLGSNNKWTSEQFSNWQTWPLAGILIFYLAAVMYAPIQLYLIFTHQDIVLIGLAGVWCGILIVILVNSTMHSHLSVNG